MGFGSLVSDAGLRDADVTIDGSSLILPATLGVTPNILVGEFSTMLNLPIYQVPYWGDGLPNQPDSFLFDLLFELSVGESSAIDFLETVRSSGGIHTFVLWKMYRCTYTLRAGQTLLYLPRPDAFTKNYAGKTNSAYKAIIKRGAVGGVLSSVTVDYPGTPVTSGTVVTAGHAAISSVASVHPDSGKNVMIFKLGTAPTGAETLTVDFHPVFNVFPRSVMPKFGIPGREDKDLYLVECN
jgi:hypothetical protein